MNEARFNGATFHRTWKQEAGRWDHPGEPGRASMEPRSLERGNHPVATARQALHLASMEPRSLERGNATEARAESSALISFNGATFTRTWKPLHASALLPALSGLLQWSHVHSNVETSALLARSSEVSACFNGATFTRTWKPGVDPL